MNILIDRKDGWTNRRMKEESDLINGWMKVRKKGICRYTKGIRMKGRNDR